MREEWDGTTGDRAYDGSVPRRDDVSNGQPDPQTEYS